MTDALRQKCDLLIKNKEIVGKSYKWSADALNTAAAYLFTAAAETADPEALKHAETIMKAETEAFSSLRGTVKVPLLGKMLLSGQPEIFLRDTDRFFKLLKKNKWFSFEFYALAAMVLAEHADGRSPEELVSRSNQIYELMKEQHPWLTSGEDIVYAAVMAVTDLEPAALIAEAERNYAILQKTFRRNNAIQSLSYVLAPGASPAEEKCAKLVKIFEGLKQAGHKYSSNYQLAALGPLSLSDIPEKQLIREIIEADEYLKEHKGFGNFVMGSDTRRMYAAQMVLLPHLEDKNESDGILLGSMLALNVAMEVTMLILISSIVTINLLNN